MMHKEGIIKGRMMNKEDIIKGRDNAQGVGLHYQREGCCTRRTL